MSEELLTYAEVRKIMRWGDNRSIRDRVKLGLLTRVKVDGSTHGWRITAASLQNLLAYHKMQAAEGEYVQKARMQTMRERKGLDTQSQEVLIDSQECIRRFNEGRLKPVVDPEVDQDLERLQRESQSKPLVRMRFGQVRGI